MEKNKLEIDGDVYDRDVVEAFCRQPGRDMNAKFFDVKPETQSWYWDLVVSHLRTFKQGHDCGYEAAMEDIPDCDNCERINPEDGPPESHYSQQDR